MKLPKKKVLIKNLILGVDPTMRRMVNGLQKQFPLGAIVKSFAVEKVVESTVSQHKKHDLIQDFLG
jgi:NADPH-dependent curcumin reductase CurA